MKPKPTPDRITIKTGLTKSKVDAYWRILGFEKEYWMSQPPAMRYELALNHLLAQCEQTEARLNEIKPIDS